MTKKRTGQPKVSEVERKLSAASSVSRVLKNLERDCKKNGFQLLANLIGASRLQAEDEAHYLISKYNIQCPSK